MAEAAAITQSKATGFIRGLGLLDSTMIVAGSMIGSGIFIVSGGISKQVGSPGWLLVVWIITGLLTVTAALSYGELAAMMPHAGGQYIYLREAFSPLWGFLYGWTFFLVIQTGTIAAVAISFAKYLGLLWPSVQEEQHYFHRRGGEKSQARYPFIARLRDVFGNQFVLVGECGLSGRPAIRRHSNCPE